MHPQHLVFSFELFGYVFMFVHLLQLLKMLRALVSICIDEEKSIPKIKYEDGDICIKYILTSMEESILIRMTKH